MPLLGPANIKNGKSSLQRSSNAGDRCAGNFQSSNKLTLHSAQVNGVYSTDASVTLLLQLRTKFVLKRTEFLQVTPCAITLLVDAQLFIPGEYLSIRYSEGGRLEKRGVLAPSWVGLWSLQSLGSECHMCLPEPPGCGNRTALFMWRGPRMECSA